LQTAYITVSHGSATLL